MYFELFAALFSECFFLSIVRINWCMLDDLKNDLSRFKYTPRKPNIRNLIYQVISSASRANMRWSVSFKSVFWWNQYIENLLSKTRLNKSIFVSDFIPLVTFSLIFLLNVNIWKHMQSFFQIADNGFKNKPRCKYKS